MTDTTDTTTAESIDTDAQRAVFPQSKTRRVERAAKFFSENFADEERTFIDPKENDDGLDAQNLDVSSINPLDIPNAPSSEDREVTGDNQ
jgi:hypothetical protein